VDFSKSLQLKPDDARAYNNRGVAYLHTGRNREAITDFSKALEIEPDHGSAELNLRKAERL
jgi:Flp pilus assembly protein TadD